MKPPAWMPGARLAFVLAGCGFCVLPQAARAQAQAPIVDVETRLRKLEELNEKLEKQNQKLAEQNEKLEKQNHVLQSTAPDAAGVGSGDAAPAFQPDEVKKLVDAYLQEKNAAKAAPEEGKAELGFKTRWQDGFVAETANKDFRVHLGGRFQEDFGWFSPTNAVNKAIPGAFNVLYRLERACEVQVMAMAANTKLVMPSQEILEKTYDVMKPRPQASNRNGGLAWPALLRKLDRVDTSYRN